MTLSCRGFLLRLQFVNDIKIIYTHEVQRRWKFREEWEVWDGLYLPCQESVKALSQIMAPKHLNFEARRKFLYSLLPTEMAFSSPPPFSIHLFAIVHHLLP